MGKVQSADDKGNEESKGNVAVFQFPIWVRYKYEHGSVTGKLLFQFPIWVRYRVKGNEVAGILG